MIEAILWDNDGLLVDSEALFFGITKQVFAEAGLHINEEYWGIEYLGNAKRSYQIAGELGLDPGMIPDLIDRRNDLFVEQLHHSVPLMPKVRETIESLSGRVRLGIVTGSPRDKLLLMHGENRLLDHFEVIVTDDEIDHPKPHPEPYLKALAMLGVHPDRCLAVEDSRRGLDSAVAAGLRCIVVPNELTGIQSFERAWAVEQDAAGVLKHLEISGCS